LKDFSGSGAVNTRRRVKILRPPELEGACHHLELRTAVAAADDFSFIHIILLQVEIILALGTDKLVPLRDTTRIPSWHKNDSCRQEGYNQNSPEEKRW
jgi:hypothetical protein